mgnify:CR=1 FL=1
MPRRDLSSKDVPAILHRRARIGDGSSARPARPRCVAPTASRFDGGCSGVSSLMKVDLPAPFGLEDRGVLADARSSMLRRSSTADRRPASTDASLSSSRGASELLTSHLQLLTSAQRILHPLTGPPWKNARRRHHAILLEHLAVLHHELHVLQRVHIVERIARHGDQVGEEASLDRAARRSRSR